MKTEYKMRVHPCTAIEWGENTNIPSHPTALFTHLVRLAWVLLPNRLGLMMEHISWLSFMLRHAGQCTNQFLGKGIPYYIVHETKDSQNR
jgi:hypothetical protein